MAHGTQGADLYVCEGTAAAARMAAGCCVAAVQGVLRGDVGSAFAVVRPPGGWLGRLVVVGCSGWSIGWGVWWWYSGYWKGGWVAQLPLSQLCCVALKQRWWMCMYHMFAKLMHLSCVPQLYI